MSIQDRLIALEDVAALIAVGATMNEVVDYISAELVAAQKQIAINEEEMRAEWRAAGGSIHGPIVETVTMREVDYLRFRAAIKA